MEFHTFRSLMDEAAAIPPKYVGRYPHLRTLADRAAVDPLAMRDFTRTALTLPVPAGVTPAEVWQLSGLAEGWK